MTAWQKQRIRAKNSLQFAISDQRASPSNTADECAQEKRGLDYSRGRIRRQMSSLGHIMRHTRQNRRSAHKRVESGDQLRQIRDRNAFGYNSSKDAADAHSRADLNGQVRVDVHLAQRSREARRDANHAQGVSESSRGLIGEAAQSSHAAQRSGQIGQVGDVRVVVDHAVAVRSQRSERWYSVQVVELGRIGRSLEHVQHSLGDYEPASDVDRGDERSGRGKPLRGCQRQNAAAHQQKTARSGDARYGVGDGHERRVESGRDVPDGVKADDARQGESGDHVGEGGIRRDDAQADQAAEAGCVLERVFQVLLKVVLVGEDFFDGLLFGRV